MSIANWLTKLLNTSERIKKRNDALSAIGDALAAGTKAAELHNSITALERQIKANRWEESKAKEGKNPQLAKQYASESFRLRDRLSELRKEQNKAMLDVSYANHRAFLRMMELIR